MRTGSRLRSRGGLAVGLVILVVLAGCGGSPPAGRQTVTVDEGIDRDCDGYYQSFELTTDVRIGTDSPASGDAWVDLSYRTDGGEFTKIRTFEDLSGWESQQTITLSASDLGGDRTTVELRAVGKRSAFFGAETVSRGTSELIKVEPSDEDESGLEPLFTQEPGKPNRTEQLTLTAATGDIQCPVDAYEWDVDDDGTFEQNGQKIPLSYPMDGRHNVTLRVTDAGGTTEEVTDEVLVFHDPDEDGVTTVREQQWGTDPRDWDSDSDLFGDRIDPAPNTLLVPTGLIHLVLSGVMYLSGVWYRDLIRQWFATRTSQVSNLGGRSWSQIRNPVTGARMLCRRIRSQLWSQLDQIKRWIDQLR